MGVLPGDMPPEQEPAGHHLGRAESLPGPRRGGQELRPQPAGARVCAQPTFPHHAAGAGASSRERDGPGGSLALLCQPGSPLHATQPISGTRFGGFFVGLFFHGGGN